MVFNLREIMQFFVFRKPEAGSPEDRSGRSDAIKEEGFSVGDAIRGPVCNRPLSMLKWLPPYRIELESWGKHYGDVADVGDDLIVSERFMHVFSGCGLKGLVNVEPVEIVKLVHHRGKPMEPLPKYFKATVVRSQTAIDQEASGYVWEDQSKVCSECLFDTLKRYRALIVQAETWSGDDVFYPRGGNGPLVSDRFKTAFVQNSLKGAIFVPAEDDCYDFFPWEKEAAPK